MLQSIREPRWSVLRHADPFPAQDSEERDVVQDLPPRRTRRAEGGRVGGLDAAHEFFVAKRCEVPIAEDLEMAGDALVGNMNTEWLLAFMKEKENDPQLNQIALTRSLQLAEQIFV